jgi:hypothetical protein
MSVWYEIVVTGTEDAVRRFVAASERALGGREAAVFGHDLDLEASPISQRLRGLFAGGSRHVLFAASGLAERIIAGLRDRGRRSAWARERGGDRAGETAVYRRGFLPGGR